MKAHALDLRLHLDRHMDYCEEHSDLSQEDGLIQPDAPCAGQLPRLTFCQAVICPLVSMSSK